jgi:hypothetical protein
LFVRQDLGEGDAGMIVDSDMNEVEAHAAGSAALIVMNAMSGGAKAAQFFDVEMEQIARSGVLVTLDGKRRFQIANAIEFEPAQDAAYGGRTQSGVRGDTATGPALPTQLLYLLHQVGGSRSGELSRSRTAIGESATPFGAKAKDPFSGGASVTCWFRTLFARASRPRGVSRAFLWMSIRSFLGKLDCSSQSASLVSIERTTY